MSYCHQLNGFKYSFNRNNPYIDKVISENQPNTNLPLINTQPQHKHLIHQNPTQSNITVQTITTIKSPSSIIKNNKSIFYNKFQQNQKNKVLIDLYLKKSKSNQSKLSPKRINNAVIKQKLNQINSKHSHHQQTNAQNQLKKINHHNVNKRNHHNLTERNQNNIMERNYYTLTERNKNNLTERNYDQYTKHYKRTHHRHSSTTNYRVHSQNIRIQLQESKQKQVNEKNQSIKTKTKKQNNSNKLIRNLSQNKFHVYLTYPKQYVKIKPFSLGTAPVSKLSKFTTSVQSFQYDHLSKINLKKNKHTKYLSFKINTEGSLDQYTQSSSFMNSHNVKNNVQTVRSKIGALKYKSPKLLLSSKNHKFLTKKQPKIRLFTSQQQEKTIIKEFKNQQPIQ